MGSGFGFSGLSSLKNNRKLLKKKNRSIELTARIQPFEDPKRASEEQLNEIKENIKREQKREQKKLVLATILAILLILLFSQIIDWRYFWDNFR